MNIFIDIGDMEERCGEQLYQDYLVEQNKNLQQEIQQLKEDNILIKIANKLVSDKLKDYKLRCDKATNYYYKTLAEYEKENKQMPEESVMMFNLLEGNR